MAADPIDQFEIKKIVTLGHIGRHEIAFTNSAAFMIAAVVIVGGLLLATAAAALVPGRLQSVAEITYEFVADMVRSTAGKRA